MRMSMMFVLVLALSTAAFGFGHFEQTGSIGAFRDCRMIAVRPDATAVIVGGTTENRVEIYDPSAGVFSYGGAVNVPRVRGAVVVLPDGRLVAFGGLGRDAYGNWRVPLASVEILDPVTNQFTMAGSMTCARYDLTATMLADGTVLLAGGATECNGSRALACAEIYHPDTGTFERVGDMVATRQGHTATLLLDDRVLLTGGVPGTGNCGASYARATGELYNPVTRTFMPAASTMSNGRFDHAAVRLADGTVLVGGGVVSSFSGSQFLRTADLFDPATNTFRPVGQMSVARARFGMALLPDGSAMAYGGENGFPAFTDLAEVFDAVTGTFVEVPSRMIQAVGYFGTVPLLDGRIMLVGGSTVAGRTTMAELFVPDVPDTTEIDATINFDPDVLNPRSCGRWVTCYIELPDGYAPEDIVMATIMLNGTVPAEVSPTSIGDYDDDGIADRMVKFSRADVVAALPSGEEVEVEVSGRVGDVFFRGTDTIRVLAPRVIYPNGGEVLHASEECVITWERPFGQDEDCYDLYFSEDGETWELLDSGIDSTTYAWDVPNCATQNGRIMVVDCEASEGVDCDECDERFSIVGTAGVTPDARNAEEFRFAVVNSQNGTSAMEFVLPEAGKVTLTLHDVTGRLVKTLVSETLSPGYHSVIWDGVNESGDEVPAGIYFARIEAGTGLATGKAVLVR